MRHSLAISLFLTVFWLANSGHSTPLLLGLGVASVALVTWISHRMNVVGHESQPLQILRRIPGYWAWLARQILLSNLDVVRKAWWPGSRVEPTLKRLPLGLTNDITRVIYANSINLTPGTLAIELKDNTILVHGLTQAAVEALEDGTMERRVAALERD